MPRGREGTMILVDWGYAGFTGSHSGLKPISGHVVRELRSPSGVLSHGTPLRERNYQCPHRALIISLPLVFPPTYVGSVGIV